jgi:vacuolar-type H+-ATPase subunit I/STV1
MININALIALTIILSGGMVALAIYLYSIKNYLKTIQDVLDEHDDVIDELAAKHNELVYVINEAVKKEQAEREMLNTLNKIKDSKNIGQA